MQLKKRTNDWSDFILILNGHVTESGEVIPSNVATVIHLGIHDIGHIFEQIAAFENYEELKYSLDIRNQLYTFTNEMVSELLILVEQTWFDYELGRVEM
jgi:archaellum biogenesis protein FlaJ (TadC family)